MCFLLYTINPGYNSYLCAPFFSRSKSVLAEARKISVLSLISMHAVNTRLTLWDIGASFLGDREEAWPVWSADIAWACDIAIEQFTARDECDVAKAV